MVSKEINVMVSITIGNLLVNGFIVVQARVTITSVKAASEGTTQFTDETMVWDTEVS